MRVTSWPDRAAFVEKIASMHGWVPDSHEKKQKMSGGFAGLNDYCPVTCIFTLVAAFLQYDAGG